MSGIPGRARSGSWIRQGRRGSAGGRRRASAIASVTSNPQRTRRARRPLHSRCLASEEGAVWEGCSPPQHSQGGTAVGRGAVCLARGALCAQPRPPHSQQSRVRHFLCFVTVVVAVVLVPLLLPRSRLSLAHPGCPVSLRMRAGLRRRRAAARFRARAWQEGTTSARGLAPVVCRDCVRV